MPVLNIAFDGKTAQELITFIMARVQDVGIEVFNTGKINIKVNDLLEEIGIT